MGVIGIGLYKVTKAGDEPVLVVQWSEGTLQTTLRAETDVQKVIESLLGKRVVVVSEVEVRGSIRGLFKVIRHSKV